MEKILSSDQKDKMRKRFAALQGASKHFLLQHSERAMKNASAHRCTQSYLAPALSLKETRTHPGARLQTMEQLKKQLENERDQRARVYIKFRRGANALDGIDAALVTVSMGLGLGRVGL
jgi:hypothetical protein